MVGDGRKVTGPAAVLGVAQHDAGQTVSSVNVSVKIGGVIHCLLLIVIPVEL